MRRRMLIAVVWVLVAAHHGATAGQGGATVEPKTPDGLLLVVSMDESKVDIVDEATLTTVASMNTGKSPHEVRVAPDGRSAYVVAGRTITAIRHPETRREGHVRSWRTLSARRAHQS